MKKRPQQRKGCTTRPYIYGPDSGGDSELWYVNHRDNKRAANVTWCENRKEAKAICAQMNYAHHVGYLAGKKA